MGLLDQRIALVTGGSRGIGRAIALALADAGADVMISYRSATAEADATAAEIRQRGRQSTAYQSDAASFAGSKEIVEKIVEQHKRLDILVNNAGITKDGLLMRMNEEDWDAVMNTNLKSAFNFSKAAVLYGICHAR